MEPYQESHPRIQEKIPQQWHLQFHRLNPKIFPVPSLHILQVVTSNQSHAQFVPMKEHPLLFNMEMYVVFPNQQWIYFAIMKVNGRRINTVNTVTTKMEMVMWDHFAVRNQNILALNPQIFQVILFKKCGSMVILLSCT